MKQILVFMLIGSGFLLFAEQNSTKKFTAEIVPKNMSVVTKKKRFYSLLVPAVDKVHAELNDRYIRVKDNIIHNIKTKEIENLKSLYKVKSDEKLLHALKPHPKSIVLAQAAMESAWGTSRFFRKANNVFGMWSSNKKESRIAAAEKRDGKRTIWLRKFDSVEDSVRAYYKLMARGKAFKEFRETRYETDNVHEIVKKLDRYSEIGELYGEELSKLIKYNRLRKYDK